MNGTTLSHLNVQPLHPKGKTCPQWAFKLNSAPAAEETWDLTRRRGSSSPLARSARSYPSLDATNYLGIAIVPFYLRGAVASKFRCNCTLVKYMIPVVFLRIYFMFSVAIFSSYTLLTCFTEFSQESAGGVSIF
jgi:hypothetical protein